MAAIHGVTIDVGEEVTESGKAGGLSPAMRFIRMAFDLANAGSASWRRVGYVVRGAVTGAIEGALRFNPSDFTLLDQPRADGGVSMFRMEGEGKHEEWYSLAVENGHATAMTALERYLKRKRYVIDGKVLKVGQQFRLAAAITDGNPAGWVCVSSFAEDGSYINVHADRDDRDEDDDESVDRKCPLCRQWKGYERDEEKRTRGRRRFKVKWVDIDAVEKARAAVCKMAFEVPGDDPMLREFAGDVVAERMRARLRDIATLKLGDELRVVDEFQNRTREFVLRRIDVRTHDLLQSMSGGGEWGHSPHEKADQKKAEKLVEMGLALRHERWSQWDRKYVITDAGRARLRLLTAAEVNARRDAEEERTRASREQEARRREQANAGRMANYTEEQLNAVVTFADSIAAGNCQTGTQAWIDRYAPGRTEMTVRELLSLDAGRNTWNVDALIRAGLARASAPPPVAA